MRAARNNHNSGDEGKGVEQEDEEEEEENEVLLGRKKKQEANKQHVAIQTEFYSNLSARAQEYYT